MEMDRIRMKSNSDIAFYHILIRMQIQIFSNMDAKWIPWIRIRIQIFTQFNAKRISLNLMRHKILVPRSSIAKANQNQIIHLIIFQVIVN